MRHVISGLLNASIVFCLFFFSFSLPLCADVLLFRKSTKRVLELEIQLENTRVASPVSSGAESQSDTKDTAAFKIRIKSLEREVQQKKQEAEKLEIKLTEQSMDELNSFNFCFRYYMKSLKL